MEAAPHLHDITRHHAPLSGASRCTASISLVLPAFNEEDVIEQAIREADDSLRAVTDDYEILVVDDGSRDATRARALREAQGRPAVRVLGHETNEGYGAALRTGFRAATKQYVGFTDADCQFDVREIGRLIILLDDCDVACGYRIDRQDAPRRIIYSKVYNSVVRLLLGTRVRDCDCAMKLFRREALGELPITTGGFLVNAELLARARMAGQSVVEVGVTHRPRLCGKSTVSIWHTIPVLMALLRFWWSVVLFPGRGDRSPQGSASDWGPVGRWAAAVLLAVGAGVMLFGNLAYPLVEPDESRYAQVALEMLQSGDYVVPRVWGEPYLDKPPLLYWVTAGSFRLFGPSQFAARFPSAAAALLTILATFFLGARLIGTRAAFCGSSTLLLSLGFVLSGRFLVMDGLLTLFTTLCLLAMFLAVRGPRLRLTWWTVAAVACGLGVLTKGPVAIVLTVPPLAAFLWLDQTPARVRPRHWLGFLAVLLVITVPWFVLIAARQAGFTSYFLWRHHVVRFVSAFNHQAPFWYYLPVLLIGLFPGSLLLGPLLDFLVGRREAVRRLRTPELGSIALTCVWILAFFSLSSCKLPTYILPAVPFVCLLQGHMLHHLLGGRYARAFWPDLAQRLPVHALNIALIIGAGLAVTDVIMEPDGGWGQAIDVLVIGSALAFLSYRALGWRSWPVRTINWVAGAGVSLLVMGFAFQEFVPEFARYRSISANAAELCRTSNDTPLPVVYFEWQSDGCSFELSPGQFHRYRTNELASLQQFVLAHPQTVLVADAPHVTLLQDTLGSRISLSPSRRGRGRLHLVSTVPATAARADAHAQVPTQR